MDEKSADAIFNVANRAVNHLSWARELRSELPPGASSVFLQAVLFYLMISLLFDLVMVPIT